MERNLDFEADADSFREEWRVKEQDLSHQIEAAHLLLDQVTYTQRDLLSIAALTTSLNVDGHRADLVILKTARAHAAFEGRTAINGRDIALASELALPHRIKRGPFQQAEITMEDLQEKIEQLQGGATTGDPEPLPGETETAEKKKV
jgi:Mg-chelatase subunit ChlI